LLLLRDDHLDMVTRMNQKTVPALQWKLRRIAVGLRQQDVANAVGISTTRYSGIERAELIPTKLEQELLEQTLPPHCCCKGGQ
jgi:DNA-binding XRE family transcriptional regulator